MHTLKTPQSVQASAVRPTSCDLYAEIINRSRRIEMVLATEEGEGLFQALEEITADINDRVALLKSLEG